MNIFDLCKQKEGKKSNFKNRHFIYWYFIFFFQQSFTWTSARDALNDIDRIDGNLQRRKWACKYTENKFPIWNIIISIYWRVI